MKKTLYQILGVDPKASMQDIEAVYSRRLDELKVATIHDPNKLVILQQSKAVLCDPVQRAAYDASIFERDVPASSAPKDEPQSSFSQKWGKWIAAGVALGIVVWWAMPSAVPPSAPQPAKQNTSQSIEPVSQPVEPAAEPAAPNNVAAPAASLEPPADLRENPVMGGWSCTDAISGRTSQYNFQQDGVLRIASGEGQIADLQYALSGKTLTLTDSRQVRTLAIEELVARKMILNTGAEGRRLVCKR